MRTTRKSSPQRLHHVGTICLLWSTVLISALGVMLLLGGCSTRATSSAETATALAPAPPPPPPIISPQWGGGLSRNMVSDETELPSSFTIGVRDDSGGWQTSPVNINWVAELGRQTYGTPTVADGRVFVGTNNGFPRNPQLKGDRQVLMCFSEDDGDFLWQLASPSPVYHGDFSMCGDLGICTSAALDDNRAYVVTSRCHVLSTTLDPLGEALQPIYTGQAGYLAEQRERFSVGPEGVIVKSSPDPPVKLTPTDANIVWVYDMMTGVDSWPHDAVSASPLLLGDYLYVGTGNAEAVDEITKPSPDGPSLIVLDKHTGELVARDEAGIVPGVHHGQWSSPSHGEVDGRGLIFYGGGDGICYAFDATPTSGAEGEPGTLKTVWRCDANPPEIRQVRYLKPDGPSEIIGTPVCHDDRIYVAVGQDPFHGLGRGALSCIDATGTGDISKTGVIWRYTDINRSVSTVSIADGLVYIADLEGILHCVDAQTGKMVWTQDLGSSVWGSTLCADGKVYVGTELGELWIMKAGREKQTLATIPLNSPMYSTPVVANGALYLATGQYLYAVSTRKTQGDETA